MFFINHQPAAKCNAVFSYINGATGRKVIVTALKTIKDGEEIFAQYSDE
jgi:SET domain-containing protein